MRVEGTTGKSAVNQEHEAPISISKQGLHQHPTIIHQDIRWPNVIRALDNDQHWFLIDWDDAAFPPAKAQVHFIRTNHSPRIFEDGHGPEVDIWGVGELIISSFAVDVSQELLNIGRQMKDDQTLSATQALKLVANYQSSQGIGFAE